MSGRLDAPVMPSVAAPNQAARVPAHTDGRLMTLFVFILSLLVAAILAFSPARTSLSRPYPA